MIDCIIDTWCIQGKIYLKMVAWNLVFSNTFGMALRNHVNVTLSFLLVLGLVYSWHWTKLTTVTLRKWFFSMEVSDFLLPQACCFDMCNLKCLRVFHILVGYFTHCWIELSHNFQNLISACNAFQECYHSSRKGCLHNTWVAFGSFTLPAGRRRKCWFR